MQLFGRTGGYYLFWTGFIYLLAGLCNIFIYRFAPTEVVGLAWVVILCLPFAIPQFGRWLNMTMPWDKKEAPMTDNVVPFPEPKLAAVPEPKPREHYRVGFNTDGDTTLTLMTDSGTSLTLTMSRGGCEQLIKMLRATYIDEVSPSNEV